MVPKEEDEWTKEKQAKNEKNHRALNILICAINPTKFNSLKLSDYQDDVGHTGHHM